MAAAPDRPTCGAKTKGGGACANPPGKGTDHPGAGHCKFHGGSSPGGRKHAAKEAAVLLAGELAMEPHDALLWCVRVAAAEVRYFTQQIVVLAPEALLVEHRRERVTDGDSAAGTFVETINRGDLHVWVRARQDALDRLARFAKMAVDAGVAERHVRIAEQLGEGLARLLEGVLGELELTADQRKRAPAIVHRQLILLEGGAEAA